MGGDNVAKLNIVVTAQNQADAALKGISSSLKSLEPAFKTAAVAGSVAFTAISGEGVLALKAFSDAQTKMTVANQALANALSGMSDDMLAKLTGTLNGTGTSMQQLQAVMASTSKAAIQLGFDDEDTSLAFAKLFQSTKDVTETQRELKLAMDLSAYSGRSLEDSVLAIQQVHAGGARVLREFGLQVDDTKDSMSVLAAVEQAVGGSAAKASGDIAVQMRALSIQTQNLQEDIGGALAPALTQLLQAITPIIEKLGEWTDAHPKLAAAVLLITGALAGLVAVLGIIGLALPGIILAFTALSTAFAFVVSGPGLAIVAIIALLALTITNLIGIFNILKNDWSDVWLGMKVVVSGVVNDIIGMMESMVNFIIDGIDGAIHAINSLIGKLQQIPGIGKHLSTIGDIGHVSLGRISVNDAIITPQGQVITTHPDDYLIATKNPAGLGGGFTVNINGGTYLSQDAAEQIGDLIIKRLMLSNAV